MHNERNKKEKNVMEIFCSCNNTKQFFAKIRPLRVMVCDRALGLNLREKKSLLNNVDFQS